MTYAASLRPLTDRVRQDVSAVKLADGSSRWTDDPLTPERINAHLAGTSVRGVTQINAGESTTRVAVLDFDSHKGETSWDEMLRVAGDVADSLKLFGLEPIAWRSSGGRGVHLYMLWNEPQDAYSVRMLLRDALATCALQDGAKGVANGQVEVFPRQDDVSPGGYGNQVILPLAGASVPLDLDLGMALDREAALHVQWALSMAVPTLDRPVREVASSEGVEPIAKVRSALSAITCTDYDYHGWHRMVCAVHEATGGSDEALDLVLAWSEAHPNHDPKLVRQRIWPYVKSERANGVTRATLFAEAAKRDWSLIPAATPDGFTDCLPAVINRGAGVAPLSDGGEDDERPWDDELPPFSRGKKGIETTMTNMVMAVRSRFACSFRIGFDGFRDEIMVRTGGSLSWRPFSDADYTRIRIALEQWGWDGELAKEKVRDAVELVARDHAFDSAQLWLKSLQWDGKSRIAQWLAGYMGADPGEYPTAVSLYTWTALAGRVMEPGCQADMVPILIGSQGARKSSAVTAMVPSMDFHASVSFNEQDDNLARKMRGKLVAEFGELRGLRTKEVESIKEFITRRYEEWVPKFKEFGTKFPRRLIFIGTTNEDQFLADHTGNRRWLPVRVGEAIDVEGLQRDLPQMWAEARELWAAGGVAWRDAERLARLVHGEHELEDPWEPRVATWLDGADFDGQAVKERSDLTAAMVLTEALRIEPARQERGHQMKVAGVLKRLGYVSSNRRDGKRVFKVWNVATVATLLRPVDGEVAT